MHIRLVALALALGLTFAHDCADAGGVPDKLPADWVTLKAGPDVDIVDFKAMAREDAPAIAAGIAVTAPIAAKLP